ncbi:substrate-binding domain-containing protein [Noviherbaspirillum sp. DKR-6]|uniref:Substrate-binding domain-containing protein n=2 Tax=Noviherbaspirillum pedocola TaxID=2801341 RepID=A0A934SWF0_9BURK|nr:substrate-binding domain-containing protein [Noviherbaspirillum pedocola]
MTLPGCASRVNSGPEPIRLLSGGAAKGLLERLGPAFDQANHARVEGEFGAVGAMRDKLLAGEDADVMILSKPLIDELAQSGRVLAETVTPLGQVKTGVCLVQGRPKVEIRDGQDLRKLLSTASAIYFPDPKKATAGIHFMKVLKALGMDDASRLRVYPDGAVAMAAMARARDPMAVGCTQITEILITPGVELTGLLPPPFELSTTYVAAVVAASRRKRLARELIAHLADPKYASQRQQAGFVQEPV